MNALDDIATALAETRLIPYLGAGMLGLCSDYAVPATPEALVARLTAKASVPGKIRNNLTRSAQFIENFKHRKTLVNLMNEAYAARVTHSPLHAALAEAALPLIVDTWYDDAMADALSTREDWVQIQGLSQTEHFGRWTGVYSGDGRMLPEDAAEHAATLLYKPIGAHAPAGNYLVSDTDFVEVLTEIDIQTPIPQPVQRLRSGASFLFLGCRFNDQLSRSYARQIMKRSSSRHWAVVEGPLTRMEQRFFEEQSIVQIDTSLPDFAPQLMAVLGTAALSA